MSFKLLSLITGAVTITSVGCFIIKARFKPQPNPSKYPAMDRRTIPLNFAAPSASHQAPDSFDRIVCPSIPSMIETGKASRIVNQEVTDCSSEPIKVIVNGCEINNLMELPLMSVISHKEYRHEEQDDGSIISREYYVINTVRSNYLTVQGLFDGTRFTDPYNALIRLHDNPEPNIEIDSFLIMWGILSLYAIAFATLYYSWI